METYSSCESTKKTVLEELSKDDLIKKCKGLLAIAQKAKQAKDVLQEENNELKNKIVSENLVIENFTQQKLLHVTTIEDLKNKNKELTNRLQQSLDELHACQGKLNDLDNENISYKRQVNRLTDENEQLITHLESQEREIEEFKKLGLQQQEQLLALENSNKLLKNASGHTQENFDDKVANLQNKLSVSLEEVMKLRSENSAIKEKMENLSINLIEKDKNIYIISEELKLKCDTLNQLKEESLSSSQINKEVLEAINFDNNKLKEQLIDLDNCVLSLNKNLQDKANENNDLRNALKEVAEVSVVKELEETIEKLKEKIKCYHSKIVKFAGNVKILKENKNEILTLFKMYTDQVEDWRIKLTEATEKLVLHINAVEYRNEELHKENQALKENNAKMVEQLEAHKTDDEKSKEINEIETVKAENKKFLDEINTLSILQEEYKKQIEILTIEKEVINSDLANVLEKHQEEIKVFDNQNKKDNLEIQSKKEENERICIEYRKIITKLEGEVQLNLREIEELKQNNFIMQEELAHLKTNEKHFADKTSEEILKLVQENADLTELNKKLIESRSNAVEAECQTESKSSNDLEEVVSTLKRENVEVLTEMNEMNQALKERGETISKLEAHCEEIMKKLQIYETQANKNVDNISQKEEIIKKLQEELDNINGKNDINSNEAVSQKDMEIVQLKSEIENLKEKINSHLDSSYAESETMSTSTISRTDELNRLKDLEGSWEERYGKLRNLALKLKGKIREMTAELTREQSEKADVQQKYTSSVKTISTLQSQCDKLEDDLEVSRNETKSYLEKLDLVAVDISRDKQKLVENEELIGSLRKEIEEYNKEKSSMEVWKKQISSKVQAFRKEVEANKVVNKEYEAKITKLTAELDAKEQALKEESDCHKLTKNSLEHSNNERKKNCVLNLEMQDYERSVKELSQKLEKKQEEINSLTAQVDSQKTTVAALREQNKLLEEHVQESDNDLSSAKFETVAYKKQISDFEETLLQKEAKIQNLTQLLETARSENEELSTELSKVISEHQKVINSLRNEKEHLRSQTLGLQQSLREIQDILKLKQDELTAIQSDYDNYRVRAQSVLRQNQSRDVGLEEKLAEELSSLKARCDALSTEMNECKHAIEMLKRENEKLFGEKEEVSNKYQDALSEVGDLKNLYDQLSSKHQQTIIEHVETVRNLKVHAETLAQCYRQQLSEQEVRHNREVIELQSKIDKAPSPTEVPFPPLPTMPREEGEGSESVESNSKTNLHPLPLERLLNTDTDQEIAFMKKQLEEEESKVMHLTALLADTEQDLAKHVQMNKLLKEEIRRQQRSVEREKIAENLEYLKNVVFKFITLHSGDERSRLVPVLNTILKLSPEETQKLNMVAKGDPSGRGWANYFPMWSSPSKS